MLVVFKKDRVTRQGIRLVPIILSRKSTGQGRGDRQIELLQM